MREMWAARNMPGEVFGVTPALDNIYFKSLDGGHDTFSVIPYGTRGLEISEWLRTHPKNKAFHTLMPLLMMVMTFCKLNLIILL